MKYYFVSIFLAFVCIFQVSAQTHNIKGKIREADADDPVPFATVLVQSLPDTIQVTGVASDVNGNFEIKNISEGQYVLTVQFLGYATLYKEINVTRDLDLGILPLNQEATALSEVTISATRAPGRQKVILRFIMPMRGAEKILPLQFSAPLRVLCAPFLRVLCVLILRYQAI